MSRSLLHKNTFYEFKQWLSLHDFLFRPGKGEYQVLQVKSKNSNQWWAVYDRHNAIEHYTVTLQLEPIVKRFCKDRNLNEVINEI